MKGFIFNFFKQKYPQNFIIRKPMIGSLIISAFCFLFAIIYHPLQAHKAINLSYETTMFLYALIFGGSALLSIKALRLIPIFEQRNWNILKEISAIFIVLLGMGIGIYFAAFWIEETAQRWNFKTFFDSVSKTFMIGCFPFLVSSLNNYKYLWGWDVSLAEKNFSQAKDLEQLIHISSKLKNEDLFFTPAEFLYAKSDGNYVDFYLWKNEEIQKQSIRNSMDNIEEQLSKHSNFLRTHRAYLVNLSKITEKQGNSLGYKLRLKNCLTQIPVSRKNITAFDARFSK